MLALSKFQEIEQQLNEQIAGLVTDAKNQIEVLQTTLRNIALRYPVHESVKLHLTEYLPQNELKNVSGSQRPKTATGKPRGKKREMPFLKVEYVDGASVELKSNPSRLKLATLIKNNPSGIVNVEIGGNFNHQIYVTHKDSNIHHRISNPLPLNTSGIKKVSIY